MCFEAKYRSYTSQALYANINVTKIGTWKDRQRAYCHRPHDNNGQRDEMFARYQAVGIGIVVRFYLKEISTK